MAWKDETICLFQLHKNRVSNKFNRALEKIKEYLRTIYLRRFDLTKEV